MDGFEVIAGSKWNYTYEWRDGELHEQPQAPVRSERRGAPRRTRSGSTVHLFGRDRPTGSSDRRWPSSAD